MTDKEAVQNVLACIELDWPTTGFVANSSYPNTNANNFWRDLLRFLLDGTLPPGTKVFCGVSIPAFPLAAQN